MRDTTSNVTFDEDKQQETSAELPNNEVWDSETREIPRLSEVHLHRPHYTIVLDNGSVFDSRKAKNIVPSVPPVTSRSIDDVRNTIRELEKRPNKSPWLKAYIETLKRVENPTNR